MKNANKFLPIGTVCSLKEIKKRVMIIGFLGGASNLNNEVCDYIGCFYPEGLISSDKNLLFNHYDIEDIFYIGYKDDDQDEIQNKLINEENRLKNKY